MDAERKLSVQAEVSYADPQSGILEDMVENKSPQDGKWWRTRPTVEPLVLVFMFSYSIISSFVYGLFTERVCGASDTTDCATEKRDYAVSLITIKSVIEAAVPAVVACFVSSWSDKFGRRPVFMWCLFGNAVGYTLFAVLSGIPDLAAEWLLLPSVVASFSGGYINLMGIANIYIADVSPVEHKALRLGVLDASQYIGTMLGSGLSAPITAALKYHGVFALAAALMLASLLYTIFLLSESVPPYTQPEGESCSCCKGVFRPQLVRDALKTCLKKRPHNGRSTIFIVIAVIITGMFTIVGEAVVSYQFINSKFKWGVSDNQLYGFFTNGTTAIGTLIGVFVLVRWLRLPDAWIAIITFVFKISGTLMYAFSPDWRFMYIGGAICSVGGMVWVLARAMLVRLVTMDEIGQVFALVMTLEAIAPLVAPGIYSAVYTATGETFPGAFYLVSVGVMVVDLILLLLGSYLSRGAVREEKLRRKQATSSPSA